MSKFLAWVLLLTSVACFVLSFRAQQLAHAIERAHADNIQPIMDLEAAEWADASDAGEEVADVP